MTKNVKSSINTTVNYAWVLFSAVVISVVIHAVWQYVKGYHCAPIGSFTPCPMGNLIDVLWFSMALASFFVFLYSFAMEVIQPYDQFTRKKLVWSATYLLTTCIFMYILLAPQFGFVQERVVGLM